MPESSTSISPDVSPNIGPNVSSDLSPDMHLEASSPASAAATAEKATGVSLRAVTKKYGPVVAVQDISIDVAAGSYCCLLGPSGCGKTTTLRMIAGHEEITYGDIFIGSRRVNALPPIQRDTAMVFQSYALFPHKTVWENVDFGLKMQRLDRQTRRQRVGEMLDIVGLSAFAQRKPDNLSGGQQQRVALARALVTRPQVLLLDEPLSALDETLRVRTRGELRRLQKQFGLTFIQVTHAQDEAFSLSDQIVVMGDGHVDQVGTPQRIFNRPASRFVANFMGDNNLFEGRVSYVEAAGEAAGEDAIAQLDIPQLGKFTCQSEIAPDMGLEAAFCIRADRMQVTRPGELPEQTTNHLSARITAIEFTGYITRVALLAEATGQELLYKARTQDWLARDLQEGQVVEVHWLTEAANFLSH